MELFLIPDINECEQPGLCGPHGECLNTDSSFHCICEQGFSISADGRTCEGKTNNKTSCNYCMIKQRCLSILISISILISTGSETLTGTHDLRPWSTYALRGPLLEMQLKVARIYRQDKLLL